MLQQERFFKLLSRKMAGEATVQEIEELEQIMDIHEELKKLATALTDEKNKISESQLSETKTALAAHITKMELSGRLAKDNIKPAPVHNIAPAIQNKTKRWWLIAASIITIISSTYLWSISRSSDGDMEKVVVTKKGSRSNIKLPDGTQVWLNADSKLSYPENFNSNTREVYLTGEAYFDVAHDASHPFIIHTEKMNIKVLGTAFNVKSYPDDELEETALIKGKIEVTFNERPSEKIILNPNEKLVLKKEQGAKNNATNENQTSAVTSGIVVNGIDYITSDSVIVETVWLQNKLAFTNETFEHIAAMLERKFDIEIEFKSDELKMNRYTGLFDQQSPEKILELMSLSKSFNYKVQDKRIVLSP